MSDRTAVYRFYDADDQLLYVGITSDLFARWRYHQANSPWWDKQARIEVVWRESRSEADAEETGAVLTERPVHNVQKRGKTPTKSIRVDDDLWERFGEWSKDYPGGSSGATCLHAIPARRRRCRAAPAQSGRTGRRVARPPDLRTPVRPMAHRTASTSADVYRPFVNNARRNGDVTHGWITVD